VGVSDSGRPLIPACRACPVKPDRFYRGAMFTPCNAKPIALGRRLLHWGAFSLKPSAHLLPIFFRLKRKRSSSPALRDAPQVYPVESNSLFELAVTCAPCYPITPNPQLMAILFHRGQTLFKRLGPDASRLQLQTAYFFLAFPHPEF
jgi:hypothetical protein